MEYMDNRDLAAAVVRAVGAGLRGEHPTPPTMESGSKLSLFLAEQLGPNALRRYFKRTRPHIRGTELEKALEIRSEGFCRWVLSQYPRRPYERVIIGPPNGAMAYLAVLIGAPYLITSFTMNISGEGGFIDEIDYLERSKKLADKIFRRNHDLTAVSVYDPIHLETVMRYYNRLHVKLTEMPDGYKRFLKDQLVAGGSVILVNQIPDWQQYRIGVKLRFQVGSYGDINDDEYLLGSRRVKDFKEKFSMTDRGGWAINATKEVFPEAELGCLPEFRRSLEQHCAEQGFQTLIVTERKPEELGRKIFNLFFRIIQTEKRTLNGVLLCAYSAIDPAAAMKTAVAPLWLAGPTKDQLFAAAETLEARKMVFENMLLCLPPSDLNPLDTPDFAAVKSQFEKFGPIRPLGIHPRLYPVNPSAQFRWASALKSWARRRSDPIETKLSNKMLAETLQGVGVI